MKYLIFSLLVTAQSLFANQLTIKIGKKEVLVINSKHTKSGIIKTKENRFVGSLQKTLFNPNRKYTRTYEGFSLEELLKATLKNNIDGYAITFKALDGYRQRMSSADFLKAIKNHYPLVAYKETGKKGFTPFMKGKKQLGPGPYYLVWTNFTPEQKTLSKDPIKWPYMLSEIVLSKEAK